MSIEQIKFKKESKFNKMDVTTIIVFVIFTLYAITLVFPFFFMFMNSFKGATEFFTQSMWAFPQNPTLHNYVFAFLNFPVKAQIGNFSTHFNMLQLFFVSVGITLTTTLLNALVATASAYVLTRFKFWGRNIIYAIIIVVMIVPIVGSLPAKYKLMMDLRLLNNPIGLILLYVSGMGMPFLIMYGFFKNVAIGYAEAAYIDGASEVRVFFSIMVPIAKPAIISVSIIYAIGIWNDYTTASLFMRNIPTLAVGLNMMLVDLRHRAAYPESFAAMLIAMIPILIVFICFQKTIMKNTIAGGLKG